LPAACHRWFLLAALLCALTGADGQGTADDFFGKFNAGVTFSAVHDSSIGWYNLATPGLSYTFSPHYSADVSVSIYPYRLAPNQSSSATASQRLVETNGDVGDTLLAAHAYFDPRNFRNTITASLTLPTGNRTDLLSTGHTTFDFRDHVERYVRQTGFIVDIGGGDSSALFDRLVANQDNTVGPVAHFQAGTIVWLLGRNYIQSVAYEQLPLGDQKIYTTEPSRPGAPLMTVVTGHRVTEDNGFTTAVGIPLTSNVTFSSYYNRSLRLHLDTVSMGVTYVFRGAARPKKMSLIDRAIREAEGVSQ